MTRIGVIVIKGLSYHEVMKGIDIFLKEHSPENVDSSKEFTSWYQRDREGNGRLSIEKYFTFDFWTRKITQGTDPLTKEVTERISTENRRICLINKKENNNEHTIYMIADQGSANAITEISKKLNLDVSMRRKISFSEDFIEYLNTAEPTNKQYVEIFNGDMESTSRRAKKGKHRIAEGYLDLSMREARIQEQFREAAGIKIVAPANLGNKLPTMDIILYNNGWVNFKRPIREDDEVTYYESVLYGTSRLSEAYNKFSAL